MLDSAVVLAEENEIRPADLALRDSGSSDLDTLEIEHWERRLITEALSRSRRQRARSGQAAWASAGPRCIGRLSSITLNGEDMQVSRKDARSTQRTTNDQMTSRFDGVQTLHLAICTSSMRAYLRHCCVSARDNAMHLYVVFVLYVLLRSVRLVPRTGIGFAGRMGRGRATRPAFRASGPKPTICGRSRCRAWATVRP